MERDGTVREISREASRLFGSAGAALTDGRPALAAIQTALRRLHAPAGRARRFVSFRVGTLECLLLSLGPAAGALLLVEQPSPDTKSLRAALTRRETEVLHWLGEGKTNREIGAACGISTRIV